MVIIRQKKKYDKRIKAKVANNIILLGLKNLKLLIIKHKPVIKFIFSLIVLFPVFYYFLENGYFNTIVANLILMDVAIIAPVVSFIGYHVNLSGLGLIYNNSQFQIGLGCDGFEPIAQFIIIAISFPNRFVKKLIIMAVGASLIFGLNILRLIILFIMFAGQSSYLDLFHIEIFPVLIAIIEFGLWIKLLKISSLSQQKPV
ncbi:MAG: archaeosortase/exosortase family protein [Candidatus Kapabacteria bacterium]|nr:archaeosortase/exosortase family protein [Candidatus Kapabacteria bacterium]